MTTEELLLRLRQIQDESISTYTILPEEEPRFLIDLDQRTITIPDEFTFLGVLNDTSAETIYFEMNRFFDDVDLSQHTIVVQFLSSGEEEDRSEGIFPVTDIDLDTLPGKIVFGWTIKSEVTAHAQDVAFAVRIYTLEEGDDEAYRFSYCLNTVPNTLPIMDTLDVPKTIVPADPSYLDQWLQKMNELGQEAIKAVDSAKESALNSEQSAINAKNSEELALSSKIDSEEAAARSKESADSAEESANRAEQGAANAGWFSIEEEDGVLYFIRSDNSTDDIELVDNGEGVLEVIYG